MELRYIFLKQWIGYDRGEDTGGNLKSFNKTEIYHKYSSNYRLKKKIAVSFNNLEVVL